jgi:monofunctional biosynthetic peptidoglycan transglycosylase
MGFIRNQISYLKNNKEIILKFIKISIITILVSSNLIVIIYRFVPVYFTPLMVIRSLENIVKGENLKIQKTWKKRSEISLHLQKAVISSEDPKFFLHFGFDFEAIKKAMKANKYRRVKMGASTITQQTAKNVFLIPERSYIRKILEAYFTVLMEIYWSKERILEVYLNVIELADGVYGAEAGAQHHFHKNALNLSEWESTLLAAVLPNPRRMNASRPSHYTLRRRKFISRNMRILTNQYFERLK